MNEQHSHLGSEFFAWLAAEKGYPEQSLVRNLSLSLGQKRRLEADLVIVDPERGDPLAIVELKSRLLSDRVALATNQVRQARFALGRSGIPGYVVVTDGNERRIISVASSADHDNVELSDFPSFSALLLQARSGEVIAKEKEQKDIVEGRRRTIDRFRVACWLLAVAVLGLFVADVRGWLSLSSQQLGIFGAFAVLLLIPDITKLKLLGVEFERHSARQDEHGTKTS